MSREKIISPDIEGEAGTQRSMRKPEGLKPTDCDCWAPACRQAGVGVGGGSFVKGILKIPNLGT